MLGGKAGLRAAFGVLQDGFNAACITRFSPIKSHYCSGSEKVVGRLSNAPKFVSRSDLVWYFKECNLKAEDFVFIYDAKYRPKFIQINMDSMENFHQAQKSVTMKGRIGGRFLKLTPEAVQMDDVNKILTSFRGQSLLMVKISFGVTTEDVERFFCGYRLDSSHPIKFVRTLVQSPFPGGQAATSAPARAEFDMRALIRFKTELEALRALREKQGSFLLDKAVDLRFIE